MDPLPSLSLLGTVPWAGHGRRGALVALDCETPCTDALMIPAFCVHVTLPPCSGAVLFHPVTDPHTFWFAEGTSPRDRGDCSTPISAISETVITHHFSLVFLFLHLPSLSTHSAWLTGSRLQQVEEVAGEPSTTFPSQGKANC